MLQALHKMIVVVFLTTSVGVSAHGVPSYHDAAYWAAVAGGAALGYEINGRDGAVSGALLGAILADEYADDKNYRHRRPDKHTFNPPPYLAPVNQSVTETFNTGDLFEPGSAVLNDGAVASLGDWLLQIQAEGLSMLRIHVTGDGPGQPYQRYVLALARAEQVARFFVLNNIPRARLAVSAEKKAGSVAANLSSGQLQLTATLASSSRLDN